MAADGLLRTYPGSTIQEVHFALEVPCSDHFEAERREEWLVRRLRRPWARAPFFARAAGAAFDDGSLHTSRRRFRVDKLTAYSASSKLDYGWCLRIERRVSGTALVRRATRGIIQPSDLLDIDVRALWSSCLKLEEYDVAALGRQARGRSKAKTRDVDSWLDGRVVYDNDAAVGGLIARRAALQAGEPWTHGSALAVRASCKRESWFRPASVFTPVASPLVVT